MKYAPNYVRSGHWSGSELKKDPGAHLPDVSVIPSILPANDLAIDPPDSPFTSLSSPWRRPIRCIGAGFGKTKEQPQQLYVHGLATIFLVLDAHNPAGCRNRPVEEGVRRREAKDKRSWGTWYYASSAYSPHPARSACSTTSPSSCHGSRARARGADEADEYLMAYRQPKHRTLILIYKRTNEAPATLLPTTLIRVPHANRIDVETLRGSFGDSSTETAQADTRLPVFGLKKGCETEGRVRAASIAGDELPAAAPASASASTFATAPTSSPVLSARSNLAAEWAAASSWEGTVSSTVPSSIDLVTPKISQAYPQVKRGAPASSQCLQRRCFSSPHDPWHEDAMTTTSFADAFVARVADTVRHHARTTSRPLRSEQASVRAGNMKEHYIRTLVPKVVDKVDVLLLVLDGHDPAGATTSWSRRNRLSPFHCTLQIYWIDLVPGESAQRTILSSSSSSSSSSSNPVSPLGVDVFSNIDKGSLIDTPKRVWYRKFERMLWIIDSPGVIFDNHEGTQGQNTTPRPTIPSVLSLPSRLYSNTSPPHVTDILP
ncbi:hypothetical protein EDB84DRAFT_1569939 [Lactarius hengduanensis]|nr:hypothetical protein EDB84DRAFT_1569939 [Lactarius hengduanensis]